MTLILDTDCLHRQLRGQTRETLVSPPEAVFLRLVCSPATGQEGVVQRLHHFLVQHVPGVQVVHAGHQLVEPMAQDQPAAGRMRGVAGVAAGADSPHGAKQPTDLIHSGSRV